MTDQLKTYMDRGAQSHTGSSGFTNYFSNKPDAMAVFRDFPEAVIVDGDDDWYAPLHMRPASVAHKASIEPLAWFHSGISGIAKSGVVLKESDFVKLKDYYLRELGVDLGDVVTVYRYDSETDPARKG